MIPKPTLDLEDLKKKALAANTDKGGVFSYDARDDFDVAASPDVVLDLIARVEGMSVVLNRIWEDTEQCEIESMARKAIDQWGTK